MRALGAQGCLSSGTRDRTHAHPAVGLNQSCLGRRNDARPPLGTPGSRGPVPTAPRSPGPQSHLRQPPITSGLWMEGWSS